MNALHFLITTLFGLYLMAIVLRFWLQAVRADFYNPLSQFIVKITNPLVKPLQIVLPNVKNWNFAALVAAVIVAAGKYFVLALVFSQPINPAGFIIVGAISVVYEFLNIAFWVLIIRAILSWFSQGGYNPAEQILVQLTEPLVSPIRKVLPPMGGLDFSVLVAIIAIQFIKILLSDLFGGF
ncbi:YggT family protein [Catenovulum agarivorans]|uniref:YggT family protein n=1 Tax=Catenovulum agarivorans TaxID=1172192 RepID=UPI000311A4B4|nr:YggT family protein [Catenovulum agarivorans]